MAESSAPAATVAECAAATYSLVITAKLNDVDPRAGLADGLRRIAGHLASWLHDLLPPDWHAGKAAVRFAGRYPPLCQPNSRRVQCGGLP